MIKKHSFSLLPFVREVKGSNGKLLAIYVRITVDGVRKEISTKCITDVNKWNPEKGRVIGNTEDARLQLNETIKSFEHRAREVYNRFIESSKLVTPDSIKNEVLGLDHKSHTLVEQFDRHVSKLDAQKGIDFAPGTVTNWKIIRRHLKEFLEKKYKRKDIPLKDLDVQFLIGWCQPRRCSRPVCDSNIIPIIIPTGNPISMCSAMTTDTCCSMMEGVCS